MSMRFFAVPTFEFPHPWRRLKAAAHVTLHWHQGGPMGWCRHSTQEVSLRDNLTQAERRATLVHELTHLDRGPAIVGFEEEEEQAVRRETARWLIPLDALADALVWAYDDHEVADILWVDLDTVQTRLAALTPEESDYVNDVLDKAELTFPKSG